jgi:hypothetical protein
MPSASMEAFFSEVCLEGTIFNATLLMDQALGVEGFG